MIKKIILQILILPLLFSCAEQRVMTLIVDADNYAPEKMNLIWYPTSDGKYEIKPLPIEKGKGKITLEIPEQTQISLGNLDPSTRIYFEDKSFIPNTPIYFYAERGKVRISFDTKQWPIVTIKGGKLNSDQNRYWSEMGPLKEQEFAIKRRSVENEDTDPQVDVQQSRELQQRMMQIQDGFIRDNPGSIVSLDLLNEWFGLIKLVDFESRFNNLSEAVRSSKKGVEVADKIATAKSLLSGNPAPLFTKKDKDGNTISLNDYKGKYVLLDFWGTWCGPCRQSHPHLIELYNKYSSMGVEFINIAQENNQKSREKWLKAIEEDGLTWTQILNDEGIEECDMVTLYGISAFPTKVLINPEGILIGTWEGAGGSELDDKLREIFGE